MLYSNLKSMISLRNIFLENTNTARSLIEANCSEWLANPVTIVRGDLQASKAARNIFPAHRPGMTNIKIDDESNLLEYDPKVSSRRPSLPLLNELLRDLPAWSQYPNRFNSVIGAASKSEEQAFGAAKMYGGRDSQMFLIPFDGAIFGVCPAEDLFEVIVSNFGATRRGTLQSITYYIQEAINNQSFISPLEQTKNIKLIDTSFAFAKASSNDMRNNMTLFDLISKEWTPEKLRIQLVPIASLSTIIRNISEVWTDSKCYMIYSTDFNRLFPTQ